VPAKPLLKYNGKTQIELLLGQVYKMGYPVFLAVPESELVHYGFLLDIFPKLNFFVGFEDDPLARQYECAKKHGLKRIIRITHDKIFVDTDQLEPMLRLMSDGKLDYLFSSDFVPGSGFEIFSMDALERAARQFSRVEHISYAIKAVTNRSVNYRFEQPRKDIRLLIDFFEDTQLMRVIYATLGVNASLKDVVRLFDGHPVLKQMNKLPQVTVYTCAKNAGKWIQEAMSSVALQNNFRDYEYILIDDHSDDKTLLHMAKFCQGNKNARFIRNETNVGLASSSNIALKNARGKYIVRLDGDDFFIGKTAIDGMVKQIEEQEVDVIYPNCYAGLSQRTIQKGDERHHVGGSLFRTSAINHIKFTDNLRNHDSLDIFLRARDILKIGYYDRAIFCYRQHNESMSKTNLSDREKTRRIIESKYGTKAPKSRRR
jgi:spore coat polysaccharide biosynthesis protein SpsF (cytidylyltransferase family)